MPRGSPDWWRTNISGKSVYYPGQSFWYKQDGKTIGAGATETIVSYTVPASHYLLVCIGMASSDAPVKCTTQINKDGTIIYETYFEVEYTFPISAESPLKVAAGETVSLTATNEDTAANFFIGGLYGILIEGA